MPDTGLPVAREVTRPEIDPAPTPGLARTASMRPVTFPALTVTGSAAAGRDLREYHWVATPPPPQS
jgi:hypothetical protein